MLTLFTLLTFCNKTVVRSLAVVVAVCFCGSTAALCSDSESVRTAELDNGLKIYVISDHKLPVVVHMLLYKVGGMDDPPGYSGLAHFLEHLMFSGTEKFGDFAAIVNGLGGKFNAVTSSSYTAYYEFVGKQYLPLMMEMEADRMRNLQLTVDAMERERNVVLEERKMRVESTPQETLLEETYNASYRNGYGRPVVGWAHEIAHYDREVTEEFYRRHYNPNNAVLLLVGDIQFDDAVKLAREYYGGIKNKTAEVTKRSVSKLEPPHKSDIMLKLSDPSVTDEEILMVYNVPKTYDSEAWCAVILAADIVGAENVGFLYDELVTKKSLATQVSVSHASREMSDGTVSIKIVPKRGVSHEAIDREVQLAIAHLVEVGVSKQRIESAKQRGVARAVYGYESLEARAWFYADFAALGLPPLSIHEVTGLVREAKVEDINLAIKSVFAGPRVMGLLSPATYGGSNEEIN